MREDLNFSITITFSQRSSICGRCRLSCHISRTWRQRFVEWFRCI